MAIPVTESDFPPGRWRARWVWCESPRIVVDSGARLTVAPESGPCCALFRRRFTLQSIPSRVPARITSDSRHVVWVNGVEIARGPVRGDPRRLHYDLADLAPHLSAGENVVAALVRFYRDATPWWIPAHPTFQLGAGSFLFEASLGDDWLVSDRDWATIRSHAWSPLEARGMHAAPLESFDARRLDADWQAHSFDDSAWHRAIELGGAFVGTNGEVHPPSHPYGPLLPRPIPQLDGVTREAGPVSISLVAGGASSDDPVTQVEADESSTAARVIAADMLPLVVDPGAGAALVTFDAGDQVSGTVLLEVEAAPGTRFDVSFAEGRTPSGDLARLSQHSGFRYVARGTDDRFESLDPMGFRFARIAIRPGEQPRPVTIRRVAVHERLFPRPQGARFECSDPLLERIWAIGRRTVDLCSHDAYLDCPSREQRGWTGDSVVHQMVDLATNPDWSLARRHVELTATPRPDGMLPMAVGGDMEAADATFIPDWPLHWVRAVHNLYRYTGDAELIANLLAPAERLLRWFVPFQGRDGLLSNVTGWVLIDWSAVSVGGTCAALNALWARALRDFAEMAEWLDDRGRARWARSAWQRVASGFDAFWDEARGLYVDNAIDGVPQRAVSQHAQAAAISAGLVPDERLQRVLRALTEREHLVRASWILPGAREAPEDGNMYAGAHTLVTGPPAPWWDVEREIVAAQPFFRYVVHDAVALAGRSDAIPALCRDWGELIPRSPGSWSETWFGGSRCHAWCATPTRDLITLTLGVTPATPGFASARIAPQLGDLEWARGSIPTPNGFIEVSIDRERIDVESPIPLSIDTRGGRTELLPAGRHRISSP